MQGHRRDADPEIRSLNSRLWASVFGRRGREEWKTVRGGDAPQVDPFAGSPTSDICEIVILEA